MAERGPYDVRAVRLTHSPIAEPQVVVLLAGAGRKIKRAARALAVRVAETAARFIRQRKVCKVERIGNQPERHDAEAV
jgi:hypothetical protein